MDKNPVQKMHEAGFPVTVVSEESEFQPYSVKFDRLPFSGDVIPTPVGDRVVTSGHGSFDIKTGTSTGTINVTNTIQPTEGAIRHG